MKLVQILAVLMLFTPGFAYIIESGDNGVQFAKDTAEAQCQEDNVQAVYHCLGNIVRVVSSVEGEGSTFYKPDGKVVNCPVVAPTEMGAECLQMMAPNFCPTQAECGEAPAPQVFPGQNDSAEQSGDLDYYTDGEPASEPEEPEETIIPEPEPQPAPKPAQPLRANSEEEIPAATENKVDALISNLPLIILVLGIITVAVLFMLFRKSINE